MIKGLVARVMKIVCFGHKVPLLGFFPLAVLRTVPALTVGRRARAKPFACGLEWLCY